MKTLTLGDIHGRTIWRDIVDKEQADRVIFIGDYVDTHEDVTGAEQLANLQNIIQFKKENMDRVVLLIGNHDHHYWPGVGYSGTSGYQPNMKWSFELAFSEAQNLFKMCFVDEHKTVYSHAGFSDKFMRSVNAVGTDKFDVINELFYIQPQKFCFYGGDFSGYGEHPLQSCIWIRPDTLYRNQIDNLQVVGHTTVAKINHPAKSERRGFYLVDALANRQYLVCNDGEFEIKQLPK